MPLLRPTCEPVSFQEVAEVLAEAIRRLPGGAPAAVTASAAQLAAALDAAGFRVVRAPAPSAQLTL